MLNSAFRIILALAFSATGFADDMPDRKTTLKVYHVGNIVSATAMKVSLGGKTTSDEWASEYSETIKSLSEIQKLVESLTLGSPQSVRTYAPSLSLIVRHSEEGHQEISELLRDLGGDQHSWIQLERQAFPLIGSDDTSAGLDNLSKAEQQRFTILHNSPRLTKAETLELDALLARLRGFDGFKEKVLLKPGHRTAWASSLLWPTTAMARVNREKQTIDIRIDGITDDLGETTPFSSHVLSLAEGESERFFHQIDGGALIWRVTAKIVAPQQLVSSNLTIAPIVAEDEGIFELPRVMPRRFVPFMGDGDNAREEVRASLVLHQHRIEQGEGVYSLGVEFENLSMTHYARIEFNAMDPKLELFDAQDRAIPEGPKIATGPVPQTQVAIIPPGCFVAFPTHDPGIGLNGEKMRLGAGGQVWKLAAGTYRLRGTIPAKVKFEKPRFDETERGTALPPGNWPDAGVKENLSLPLSTLTIP